MREDAFHEMAATEGTHWWFVGRRRVLGSVLDTLRREGEPLLEIGAGSGGNLSLLAQHGPVVAVEPDPIAREIARARHPGVRVLDGALPDRLPGELRGQSLILMADVLEHVDDDLAALRAAAGLLSPGGRMIITVPAHRWLWSSHDRRLEHRRRYARADLTRLVARSGLTLERLTPFNFVLAPLAIPIRVAERLGLSYRGDHVPPALINRPLSTLFSLEARLLSAGMPIPFGLSWLAIVSRDPS